MSSQGKKTTTTLPRLRLAMTIDKLMNTTLIKLDKPGKGGKMYV
jgi:hypothetical protein